MSADDKKKEAPKKGTKVTDLLAQEELVSLFLIVLPYSNRVLKMKPLRKSLSSV